MYLITFSRRSLNSNFQSNKSVLIFAQRPADVLPKAVIWNAPHPMLIQWYSKHKPYISPEIVRRVVAKYTPDSIQAEVQERYYRKPCYELLSDIQIVMTKRSNATEPS